MTIYNSWDELNIDKEITISMPKSSVFVFEGVDKGNFDFGEAN